MQLFHLLFKTGSVVYKMKLPDSFEYALFNWLLFSS